MIEELLEKEKGRKLTLDEKKEMYVKLYRNIKFSENKDDFIYHPDNRNINNKQVDILCNILEGDFLQRSFLSQIFVVSGKDIEKAMLKKGIQVETDKLYIVDGQHRYAALSKKLDKGDEITIPYINIGAITSIMDDDITIARLVDNFNIGQRGYNKAEHLKRRGEQITIKYFIDNIVNKVGMVPKRTRKGETNTDFANIFTLDMVEQSLSITKYKKYNYTTNPDLTEKEKREIRFISKICLVIIESFDGYMWSNSNQIRKYIGSLANQSLLVTYAESNPEFFKQLKEFLIKKIHDHGMLMNQSLNYDNRSEFYEEMIKENWITQLGGRLIFGEN